MELYDTVIIGGGPAGLSAGIYAARAQLKLVLLEKLAPGGQIAVTELVENYPGFPDGVMGAELASQMEAQARKFGLPIESAEVRSVTVEGDIKIVKTDKAEYRARTLIVASGTNPRRLGIPGEMKYLGRGVSTCATCDAPLYRGRTVAVVGGGDSAIQEALFIAKFVDKCYVIHRRDELRAQKILQDRALAEPKIEFVWNSTVPRIVGDEGVTEVRVTNKLTGDESGLTVDGVFIFVGLLPNIDFLDGMIEADEKGFLLADQNMETNIPGIYAAGDVRSKILRQVATAVSDGATAAFDLEKHLD